MRLARPVLAILLSGLLLPAAAWAQSAPAHVASQATIDQTLTARAAAVRADRDAIRQLLQRPEVKTIADRFGLSVERANAAVDTLQGDQLHQMASQARQAQQDLAGGASAVVISTTTIIIGLLVLLVIILAVK